MERSLRATCYIRSWLFYGEDSPHCTRPHTESSFFLKILALHLFILLIQSGWKSVQWELELTHLPGQVPGWLSEAASACLPETTHHVREIHLYPIWGLWIPAVQLFIKFSKAQLNIMNLQIWRNHRLCAKHKWILAGGIVQIIACIYVSPASWASLFLLYSEGFRKLPKLPRWQVT